MANKQSRRLLLLRHGKSVWPEEIADKFRPLAERGRKASLLMGGYLEQEKLVPDLALISIARRTQETWALVREKLPDSPEARDSSALYETSATDILDTIRQVEPSCHSLLIVGHNPGLQELALLLTETRSNPEARRRLEEKYPTAGLAVIDFDTEGWTDIAPDGGRLERFVTPRSLD